MHPPRQYLGAIHVSLPDSYGVVKVSSSVGSVHMTIEEAEGLGLTIPRPPDPMVTVTFTISVEEARRFQATWRHSTPNTQLSYISAVYISAATHIAEAITTALVSDSLKEVN